MLLLEKILELLSDDELRYKLLYGLFSGGVLLYLIRKIRKLLKPKYLPIKQNINSLGFIGLLKQRYTKQLFNMFNSNRLFLKNKHYRGDLLKYSLPSGLINYGNNCYINVFLQCISCLPEFIYFSSKEKSETIQKFVEILNNINYSPLKILYPEEFISEICSKFEFANEQQDSYELFHRLLDIYTLDESISPIRILLKTSYYCPKCKMVRSKIKNVNIN